MSRDYAAKTRGYTNTTDCPAHPRPPLPFPTSPSAAATSNTPVADGTGVTIARADGPGFPAWPGSVTKLVLSGTRLWREAGVNGAPDATPKAEGRALPAVPGLAYDEAGPVPHRPTSMSQPFGFTAGACGYVTPQSLSESRAAPIPVGGGAVSPSGG